MAPLFCQAPVPDPHATPPCHIAVIQYSHTCQDNPAALCYTEITMKDKEILEAINWAEQWLNWCWLHFGEKDRHRLWADQTKLREARKELARRFGPE